MPLPSSFCIVFDIETQELISDITCASREDRVRGLNISCVSYLIIDSELLLSNGEAAVDAGQVKTLWNDSMRHPHSVFEELLALFDNAEVIVSYNGLAFDHPVLERHYRRRRRHEAHLIKTHDVFSRLKEVTGVWFKLDQLLLCNDLPCKSGDGKMAVQLWKEKKYDALQEYCENDVIQLAHLVLRPFVKLAGSTTAIPSYLSGLASAVAAMRMSKKFLKMEGVGAQTNG
jgi:hypothetical protein